jgi:hypothetical protein
MRRQLEFDLSEDRLRRSTPAAEIRRFRVSALLSGLLVVAIDSEAQTI